MKKTLTILLILCASLASAANFDKRLHLYSQDYTTVRVRWVRDYVTLIDSVTITLPKDTIITLDDSYNWSLEYRWMNAAGDSVEGAGPVITRKAITVTTVADKTGYSLTTAPLTPGDTSQLRSNISASIGVNPWTTQKRDSVLLVLPKVDALPVPLQPSDTDEFRANISASIGVNVWTTAKRDSVLLALGKIDAANASLVKLDSAIWQAGNGEGAFSRSVRTTNVDTLWFGVYPDTTHYRVYWHPGKYAGAPPDSTRTYAK